MHKKFSRDNLSDLAYHAVNRFRRLITLSSDNLTREQEQLISTSKQIEECWIKKHELYSKDSIEEWLNLLNDELLLQSHKWDSTKTVTSGHVTKELSSYVPKPLNEINLLSCFEALRIVCRNVDNNIVEIIYATRMLESVITFFLSSSLTPREREMTAAVITDMSTIHPIMLTSLLNIFYDCYTKTQIKTTSILEFDKNNCNTNIDLSSEVYSNSTVKKDENCITEKSTNNSSLPSIETKTIKAATSNATAETATIATENANSDEHNSKKVELHGKELSTSTHTEPNLSSLEKVNNSLYVFLSLVILKTLHKCEMKIIIAAARDENESVNSASNSMSDNNSKNSRLENDESTYWLSERAKIEESVFIKYMSINFNECVTPPSRKLQAVRHTGSKNGTDEVQVISDSSISSKKNNTKLIKSNNEMTMQQNSVKKIPSVVWISILAALYRNNDRNKQVVLENYSYNFYRLWLSAIDELKSIPSCIYVPVAIGTKEMSVKMPNAIFWQSELVESLVELCTSSSFTRCRLKQQIQYCSHSSSNLLHNVTIQGTINTNSNIINNNNMINNINNNVVSSNTANYELFKSYDVSSEVLNYKKNESMEIFNPNSDQNAKKVKDEKEKIDYTPLPPHWDTLLTSDAPYMWHFASSLGSCILNRNSIPLMQACFMSLNTDDILSEGVYRSKMVTLMLLCTANPYNAAILGEYDMLEVLMACATAQHNSVFTRSFDITLVSTCNDGLEQEQEEEQHSPKIVQHVQCITPQSNLNTNTMQLTVSLLCHLATIYFPEHMTPLLMQLVNVLQEHSACQTDIVILESLLQVVSSVQRPSAALFYCGNGQVWCEADRFAGRWNGYTFNAWVYPLCVWKKGSPLLSLLESSGTMVQVNIVSNDRTCRLQICLRTGKEKMEWMINDNEFAIDSWAHVALSHNMSVMTVYINGRKSNTVVSIPFPKEVSRKRILTLSIGSSSESDKSFIGFLRNVHLMEGSLSEKECMKIYSAGVYTQVGEDAHSLLDLHLSVGKFTIARERTKTELLQSSSKKRNCTINPVTSKIIQGSIAISNTMDMLSNANVETHALPLACVSGELPDKGAHCVVREVFEFWAPNTAKVFVNNHVIDWALRTLHESRHLENAQVIAKLCICFITATMRMSTSNEELESSIGNGVMEQLRAEVMSWDEIFAEFPALMLSAAIPRASNKILRSHESTHSILDTLLSWLSQSRSVGVVSAWCILRELSDCLLVEENVMLFKTVPTRFNQILRLSVRLPHECVKSVVLLIEKLCKTQTEMEQTLLFLLSPDKEVDDEVAKVEMMHMLYDVARADTNVLNLIASSFKGNGFFFLLMLIEGIHHHSEAIRVFALRVLSVLLYVNKKLRASFVKSNGYLLLAKTLICGTDHVNVSLITMDCLFKMCFDLYRPTVSCTSALSSYSGSELHLHSTRSSKSRFSFFKHSQETSTTSNSLNTHGTGVGVEAMSCTGHFPPLISLLRRLFVMRREYSFEASFDFSKSEDTLRFDDVSYEKNNSDSELTSPEVIQSILVLLGNIIINTLTSMSETIMTSTISAGIGEKGAAAAALSLTSTASIQGSPSVREVEIAKNDNNDDIAKTRIVLSAPAHTTPPSLSSASSLSSSEIKLHTTNIAAELRRNATTHESSNVSAMTDDKIATCKSTENDKLEKVNAQASNQLSNSNKINNNTATIDTDVNNNINNGGINNNNNNDNNNNNSNNKSKICQYKVIVVPNERCSSEKFSRTSESQFASERFDESESEFYNNNSNNYNNNNANNNNNKQQSRWTTKDNFTTNNFDLVNSPRRKMANEDELVIKVFTYLEKIIDVGKNGESLLPFPWLEWVWSTMRNITENYRTHTRHSVARRRNASEYTRSIFTSLRRYYNVILTRIRRIVCKLIILEMRLGNKARTVIRLKSGLCAPMLIRLVLEEVSRFFSSPQHCVLVDHNEARNLIRNLDVLFFNIEKTLHPFPSSLGIEIVNAINVFAMSNNSEVRMRMKNKSSLFQTRDHFAFYLLCTITDFAQLSHKRHRQLLDANSYDLEAMCILLDRLINAVWSRDGDEVEVYIRLIRDLAMLDEGQRDEITHLVGNHNEPNNLTALLCPESSMADDEHVNTHHSAFTFNVENYQSPNENIIVDGSESTTEETDRVGGELLTSSSSTEVKRQRRRGLPVMEVVQWCQQNHEACRFVHQEAERIVKNRRQHLRSYVEKGEKERSVYVKLASIDFEHIKQAESRVCSELKRINALVCDEIQNTMECSL